MTLDEAIKHCEEVAEELEKKVKPYQCESINKKLYEINKKEWDDCLECAKEHRQLAEWLRELKAYRDDRDDSDYETLKIKLENAEDVIRGLQEDLRDAREELRWR